MGVASIHVSGIRLGIRLIDARAFTPVFDFHEGFLPIARAGCRCRHEQHASARGARAHLGHVHLR